MERGIPSDMYKEHILELYKSPSNFGILAAPSLQATEYNSVCGDEITVQLIVKKGKLHDIKFQGSGCVISIVSASMLTDKIKNVSIKDIKKLTGKDVLKMLKIKLNSARIKCALLSLEAVKKALR